MEYSNDGTCQAWMLLPFNQLITESAATTRTRTTHRCCMGTCEGTNNG